MRARKCTSGFFYSLKQLVEAYIDDLILENH